MSKHQSEKPLAIDLFAGLGGWSEGLLAEGFRVVGFDIEHHEYGEHRYPGQLVIQDVRTLHGSQFKSAAVIVASPPCQEFSYMAMPWSLAKAKRAAILADTSGASLVKLTELFNTCFRIQREASEAAGHHIPLIVENVRGAQEWVGRARWSFGSFYLWGDVPALMPHIAAKVVLKAGVTRRSDGSTNFHGTKVGGTDLSRVGFNVACVRKFAHGDPNITMADGRKTQAHPNIRTGHRSTGALTRPHEWIERNDGIKASGGWSGDGIMRRGSSKSPSRKFASAMIAKIPPALSRHIASTFMPK